jgi:hypothetical protein
MEQVRKSESPIVRKMKAVGSPELKVLSQKSETSKKEKK